MNGEAVGCVPNKVVVFVFVRRWSLIAGHLPGRTDNEVKNYWNSHLSRNIKTFKTSRNQTLSPVAMDLAKAGMARNRRGGRTSRSAMKKKTNFPVKSSSKLVEEHKESKPVNVAVAIPPTPNLDKEALALSSALSWQEEIENLTLPSPPYKISEVELLGCGEERESSNLLLWPGENEQNEFLRTNHEMLDSEMSFLNDIVGNEEMDPNDDVVAFSGKKEENNVIVTEERESGTVVFSEDLESGNLSSSNAESGEGQSCSSTNSYMNEGKLDWGWDCDGGFQGNELWCETDRLLSWLWEATDNGERDCNKQLGEEEMDSEKQNAMVAWLLS
ncbi:unnamed protein product [Ilex paraguariensis]|uniref:Uncharacterized protein n=1 Tax=Ilex paraguariensis TaxID=185542 RepID=A0ABC8RJN9_9AQUA